jgi:hypothetical protein
MFTCCAVATGAQRSELQRQPLEVVGHWRPLVDGDRSAYCILRHAQSTRGDVQVKAVPTFEQEAKYQHPCEVHVAGMNNHSVV